jgi:hypothetical protein
MRSETLKYMLTFPITCLLFVLFDYGHWQGPTIMVKLLGLLLVGIFINVALWTGIDWYRGKYK